MVVYGEAKKFLVAGVWLNEAMIVDTLKARNVPAAEHAAAREKLVADGVAKVNANLASYESIKKFHIMSSPLTVEAGLLTASFKVRRKKVYEAFKAEFEGLYDTVT